MGTLGGVFFYARRHVENMSNWKEIDPNSQPIRDVIYGQVDNGNGTFTAAPIAATINADGLASLAVSSSGGGAIGTTATPNVSTLQSGSTTDVAFVTSAKALKIDGSSVTQPVSFATLPALTAGAAAIGQVGGKTTTVDVTPTITTSVAYAVGNEVGGLLTFSAALLAAGTGLLQSIAVKCKSVQTSGFKLYMFKANPSNTTWSDKTTPSINVADIPSLIGVYTLGAADSGLGTHTIYNTDGVGNTLNAGATTLYGILVTTGTPTFASTSGITVAIGVLQD